MITYDWNCRTVEARPLEEGKTDVIYNVHWIVKGISDKIDSEGNPYSATDIGTQRVTWNPEGTFTPFEDLTNEIVTNWTKSAMGQEELDYIEDNIESEINSMIKPTSVILTIKDKEV
jgi:hypothetical protein